MLTNRRIHLLALMLLLSLPIAAFATHKHPESWYVERWCDAHGGETEVVLADNTRCDCVTATHAIEFDFGEKWTEAVGQSLHYGLQTGKRSGIVLIIEEEEDRRYWIRLNATVEYYNLAIDTWETNEDEDFIKNPVVDITPWLHLLLLGQ